MKGQGTRAALSSSTGRTALFTTLAVGDGRTATGSTGFGAGARGGRFFDLRSLYVRGHARSASAPRGVDADLGWIEVVPTRTVAWYYGRMREADDAT